MLICQSIVYHLFFQRTAVHLAFILLYTPDKIRGHMFRLSGKAVKERARVMKSKLMCLEDCYRNSHIYLP